MNEKYEKKISKSGLRKKEKKLKLRKERKKGKR